MADMTLAQVAPGENPAEAAADLAREGAPAGTAVFSGAGEGLTLAVVARPAVPMAFLEALAPLGALAACEWLGPDARLGWPSSVLVDGAQAGSVATKGGYGAGVFAVVTVSLADKPGDAAAAASLRDALLAKTRAWEEALAAGGGAAGPWGPFLSDYFDRLAAMGKDVQVFSPNGHVMASGRLAGIDGWGRVTVQTSTGGEHEFSYEGVTLREVQ